MKELLSSIDLQRVHHGADGIVTAHCGVFVINLAYADLHGQDVLDLAITISDGSDEEIVAVSILIFDGVHEHVFITVPVALGDFDVSERGEFILCREMFAIVQIPQMDANEGIAPGSILAGQDDQILVVSVV